MLPVYKTDVLDFYLRKREEGSLTLNLQNPTPAKLRRECLSIYELRRDKRDQEILTQFFGPIVDEESYRITIKKWDIDNFRPLLKFLKRMQQDTDDKNVALLTWLIDFSPRPYRLGYVSGDHIRTSDQHNSTSQTEKSQSSETVKPDDTISILKNPQLTTGSGIGNTVVKSTEIKITNRYKKVILLVFGMLVTGAVGIFISNNPKRSFDTLISGIPPCMYWNGDQFVGVDCEARIPNTTTLLTDTFKLKHFKRIAQPETLTYNHINKVWYGKVNNQIEFYTLDGYDPRLAGRQLRPMSRYIFQKYIANKPTTSK